MCAGAQGLNHRIGEIPTVGHFGHDLPFVKPGNVKLAAPALARLAGFFFNGVDHGRVVFGNDEFSQAQHHAG
jgi:hypothetical protein